MKILLLFQLYEVNFRAQLIEKDSRNYSFVIMGMFKFESTLFSEEHSCASAVSLKSSSLNKKARLLFISDRDNCRNCILDIDPSEIEFEEVDCF